MQRRQFLGMAGSAALLGCCPPRRSPIDITLAASGLTPLAPAPRADGHIPHAFDVHVHLFNATDVPAREFLSGPVAYAMPTPALRNLVRLAAPIAQRIGQTLAPSCGEEMHQLRELLSKAHGASDVGTSIQLRDMVDAQADVHLDRFQEVLRDELRNSEFGRALDAADAEYLALAAPLDRTRPQPLSRDAERLREALIEGSQPRGSESLTARNLAAEQLDPKGVLRFIRFMSSPRHHNLRAYQRAYTESGTGPAIGACFASLVDFNHWLGCADTPSSLSDQIQLHEQLAVLSGGAVLPLAPYNPWSDLQGNGSSFELVKEAIQERGFVGIKIYPPMGFGPDGSAPMESKLPSPNPDAIRSRLQTVFKWCAENGVTVMGHTDHTMGREPSHDDLSIPHSWGKALETTPGLRVNAGHFGGEHDTRHDWANGFADIMARPEGRHVYGDLGIRVDLLDEDSHQAMHMAAVLSRRLASSPPQKVYERVMYGSDWLMLSRKPNWSEFASGIAQFLSKLPPADRDAALQAVFYRNAAACYGLHRGGDNRRRLEQFYQRWRIVQPAWMTMLDRAA